MSTLSPDQSDGRHQVLNPGHRYYGVRLSFEYDRCDIQADPHADTKLPNHLTKFSIFKIVSAAAPSVQVRNMFGGFIRILTGQIRHIQPVLG